jgi:hypothetical protein
MSWNEGTSFHLVRRHFIPGVLAASPLLNRRDETDVVKPKRQVKIQAIRDKDAKAQAVAPAADESACGPQCVTLLAGGAAGVLLIVFLVIGIVFYRRREAQRREEEELAASMHDDDDWHFKPRRASGRANDAPPMQQYGRGSLSVHPMGPPGGRMDGDTLQLPRKPSKAELAQMEVYRKMSVIGIV